MSKNIKDKVDNTIAIPWSEIDKNKNNPVRHTDQEYLHFIDTVRFSETSQYYLKHGVYTHAPEGTSEHKEFWDEEERRCKEGYTIEGIRITGEHYAYLNYGRILATVEQDGRTRKVDTFPKFLDMDYYWYHELETAEKNGEGMIVVKARRKGFSYKNAFGMAWKYHFFPFSISILAAFEKTFWANTMEMAKNMINFINENTDWVKGTLVDRQDHIKAGYIEKDPISGVNIQKGYKSEILALSFKDAPQKSVGRTAERMLFEEAGDWPGLMQAYQRSYPLFKDGNIMIGIPIIYGTGGNNKNGTNADFESMFYNPSAYGLRSYDNIYDDNAVGEAGWFVDDAWYREPFITEAGEHEREKAAEDIDLEREEKKKADPIAYNMMVTQHPHTPKEAFLRNEGAVFPAVELYNVLAKLKSDDRYKKLGTPGTLYLEEGEIRFKPDLRKELFPLEKFPHKPNDNVEGCVMVYQHPPETIPYGLYKIGLDPVAFDKSGSRSLNAAYVYKSMQSFEHGYDEIVAEYVGRPDNIEIYNRNLELLSEYYGGAEIMFENDRGEVLSYFKRKGKMHLLADQPDNVISKVIKDSTVSRIKGCHMNERMKDAGEKFILRWLWTERGTNSEGNKIYNMDLIPSPGLIEELIGYFRGGNFDRVMALMQVMFMVEESYEEEIGPEKRRNKAADYLVSNISSMFSRSRR
ncbi:MAG: hypothetical protein GOVbin1709_19 [Prokaryotic dsDNA virus sp.]|nr:MAG: hypothetical protein GOVbin1709_19 [Prokaryotic dsDNA virus sp.]|tara:strand:+ start:161 stop:2233 length:2073 start_codon:yes stop_codon:yes gene_type:complete